MVKRVSTRGMPSEYRTGDMYGLHGAYFSPDAAKPYDLERERYRRREEKEKAKRREQKTAKMQTQTAASVPSKGVEEILTGRMANVTLKKSKKTKTGK